MSTPHEVHEQDNGARILVPTRQEHDEPESAGLFAGVPEVAKVAANAGPRWFPRVRLRTSARTKATSVPGEPSAWTGFYYGLAAAVALSVVYNGIVYGAGLDFRILAVGCGAVVGLAVREGTPRRYARTNQLLAATLAYLTIASTYWYFFYEETLYPVERWVSETQAVAGSFGAVWGWEDTAALAQQPAAEVVTPLQAAWKGGIKSLFFPVLMLQWGSVYAAVFGLAGVVAAYKLAQPKTVVH